MNCPYNLCTLNLSESILSSDRSKIFSFVSYGYKGDLYFITFNESDGNVGSYRYKSNFDWDEVYGSALYGDYITITLHWNSQNHLILYNTVTYQFIIK